MFKDIIYEKRRKKSDKRKEKLKRRGKFTQRGIRLKMYRGKFCAIRFKKLKMSRENLHY